MSAFMIDMFLKTLAEPIKMFEACTSSFASILNKLVIIYMLVEKIFLLTQFFHSVTSTVHRHPTHLRFPPPRQQCPVECSDCYS